MNEGCGFDAALLRELRAEIQGLRQDVAALREELHALRSIPPVRPPATTPPAATTWLQRRNAERLAAEVQRRQALKDPAAGEAEPDTELDLLIDRLHDLALDNGG